MKINTILAKKVHTVRRCHDSFLEFSDQNALPPLVMKSCSSKLGYPNTVNSFSNRQNALKLVKV